MKIKTGDTVRVIAGKDKGKTGKVLQVFVDRNRVSVEGINLMTKHLKKRREGEQGQKLKFPAPLHASNVMLVDPTTNKPTRIGYTFIQKGDAKVKTRIAKKSKTTLA